MDPIFLTSQLFTGLSIASILLLAALGLALTFGLMRVINMAHGEFLMLGGYVTALSAQWSRSILPEGQYLWLAFPLAFLVTALLGMALEALVIRRLYGRPLDTLLATFGVSLILQQAARQVFGPTGVAVVPPAWLSGALTLGDLTLPHVRLFVIALAVAVLAGTWWLLNRTPFGRTVRAVNQNRDMAAALGVNTRRLDMAVFGLGAGIAGLAGVGLAMLAPVNPTVGAAYIVNAFLVVVIGGVGNILGAGVAAALLGAVTAVAEGLTSVSLAQALVLVLVVALLQWRPRGLFPTQSRALEEE